MFAAFVAVTLAIALTACATTQEPTPKTPPQPPGLTFENCTVHTGTGAAGGIRLDIGDRILPGRWGQPSTTIDLAGAFVMPGLQDAHGHLLGLGDALAEVNLVGTKSWAQVVDRVRAAAKALPPGEWVVGRGWDQNDWGNGGAAMPHHAELSAAVPDHPVWLTRIDGHAGVANTKALAAAGVKKGSTAPKGGEILVDDAGEPTGVLIDLAMDVVRPTPPTAAQVRERLLAAHDDCLRRGLTCVHDAGVSKTTLEAMVALHREGKWRLRTWVMLNADERELIARGPWQTDDGRIVVRSVKGYADGALGSRGAVLFAPYTDRPNWKGLFLNTKAGIQELAQLCADHGMQLCVHAIGDAANRAVLDAFAAVKVEGGLAERRFRIEHAQVVAADDFARFRELGVLPSMQPTHLTSDMPWATARLGPERVKGAYAFRTFLELGLVVPFGSDFPVESVDPRLGLYAAVTTRPLGGDDEMRPDQKLSRAQAIRGFTLHAAHAMFAEKDLGTIEVGKRADLTVFDRNLLTCTDQELLEAKVLLSVIEGQVVYDGRGK